MTKKVLADMENSTKSPQNESGSQMVHGHLLRNTGIPIDLGLLSQIRINKSAVERRTNTLGTRRTVKKQWQAAWLLKAITCMDLTTLSGDDTEGNVMRLCQKARNPVRKDLLEAMGMLDQHITTGAVCVYHNLLPFAVDALKGTNIPVAAVSTGFPAGQISLPVKLKEIELSVESGATEIDIVISRSLVIQSKWQELYEEIAACRAACRHAHMKTILATGELPTLTHVAKASMVAMMAGSDFIKTSTGKEVVNATLPVSLVMLRAIRQYHELTGFQVGYKPAGGISQAKDALLYLMLMKEELGESWLRPELFRFGASSLLGDIERQLEHFVTGRYSAS